MEDTLRYFFSAVFQGFAAIITLGIMFYLYYIDKLRRDADRIITNLDHYKPTHSGEEFSLYQNEGIIAFMKKYLLPRKKDVSGYEVARELVSIYDSIEEQKKSLSAKMKRLFKVARVILIISLISLFLVGYYELLDYTLSVLGIICIILSIIFLSQLFTFSKQIIDTPFD